jgi:hypothetical protein
MDESSQANSSGERAAGFDETLDAVEVSLMLDGIRTFNFR